jgi:hypothetical protein
MTSEAEIIIAFVFKRSGKTQLSHSEFYLTLSMELNWFTPESAKDFVNQSVKQKLLIKKDDQVKPSFDIKKITVPIGFYPSKQLFEKEDIETDIKEEDVLKKIIRCIIEKTELNEKKIIEKIKEIEKERNINSEVAVLLVGKEYDVPLEEFFEKIEKKI